MGSEGKCTRGFLEPGSVGDQDNTPKAAEPRQRSRASSTSASANCFGGPAKTDLGRVLPDTWHSWD